MNYPYGICTASELRVPRLRMLCRHGPRALCVASSAAAMAQARSDCSKVQDSMAEAGALLLAVLRNPA